MDSDIDVLLVEDNRGDARLIMELLAGCRATRFHVDAAHTLRAGIQQALTHQYHAVLLDLILPDAQGVETFRRMHNAAGFLPILILTGSQREDWGLEAVRAGAQDYLIKGAIDEHLLPRALRYAIERKRAIDEVHRLNADLETRVHARTRELVAANQDLEAFSYSLAHDLRGPIRAVGGFSQLLLSETCGPLNTRQQEYISRIASAGERMEQLLDSILLLCRVTRGELCLEPLDLSALAREAFEDLQARDRDRQCEYEVKGDLNVHGDARLLRVALTNLIENAWKFTRDQKLARITVGAQAGDDHPIYYVRDNGQGFDPAAAARIFLPFEQLHPTSGSQGVGVGLATVQRVIHRHGGKVWAEGSPGNGATVYFTIQQPREIQHEPLPGLVG